MTNIFAVGAEVPLARMEQLVRGRSFIDFLFDVRWLESHLHRAISLSRVGRNPRLAVSAACKTRPGEVPVGGVSATVGDVSFSSSYSRYRYSATEEGKEVALRRCGDFRLWAPVATALMRRAFQCMLTWCWRNNHGEMAVLLPPFHQVTNREAEHEPPPAAEPAQPPSALTLRKKTTARLMRKVCTMARGRMFGYFSGAGCEFCNRYLREPETDVSGAMALILSVSHEWMRRNSVDRLDNQTLGPLTGIVSACIKFACEDDMRSIVYDGIEVGVEIQILGMLTGQPLTNWLKQIHRHTRKIQAALDMEVMNIVRTFELYRHYVYNAQARAERILVELYTSTDQLEYFPTHSLYKALRALPTFYFACMYDELFLVQLPERHAPALVCAILASAEYLITVSAHPALVVAESREVLAAVLRSAQALPMAHVFYEGGANPHDEWATHQRVQRAFDLLAN